ncbi:hypothetical protein GALMADRAFT_255521 [Galerina marginata CBS 339.88]|uniref:F-box domain-containing protein n=1 Tax=Galerina marginata (strain CBS 339.88) TaxID=685588 RepID=A0A067SFL1_GALM3|nr:hypothetical protein GALMADRAFT_255521 [Galerina marginata CBS 339.88]
MDEDEEEDGYSSSDGSEYGVGKRRTTKRPPAKRPKMASSSPKKNSPQKRPIRAKKSLSLLPTMPLDLLFEIMGFLAPKDIINVSRTNKLFRETLRAKGAITIWKAARERSGIPEPPTWMSESAWAGLLFGTSCQNCGANNIQKIDFLLYRRLCTTCKKKRYVVESRVKSVFPDVEAYVLDLIPHTNVGGWAHGHRSGSRFFWDEDIEKMVQKLTVLEHGIHMRLTDARKKLDEFKAQQIQRVEDIHSRARNYSHWLDNCILDRQLNKDNIQLLRRKAICERFIQLGYTEEDVSYHYRLPEFNQSTLLTDRIWNRIRPILEPKVMERKAIRLEREMGSIRAARRQIVDGLYKTYKASLHPSQWKYLPRTLDICKFDPFAIVIDTPAVVTVTEDTFNLAIQSLPELLLAASEKKKSDLKALLPGYFTSATAGRVLEPGEVSNGDDCLDLAACTFMCKAYRHIHYYDTSDSLLVGVQDLMTHHCEGESESFSSSYSLTSTTLPSPIVFSEKGSEMAKLIIQLAGLDPRTALASDMDQKDLRFSCACCSPQNQSGKWVRYGYSWRTAIAHSMVNTHSNGSTKSDLSWTVLSSIDANFVKENEQGDSKWHKSLWTCSHCSTYMTNLQSRGEIVQHVQTVHQILAPTEPADLFFYERFRISFTKKIVFPTPGPVKSAASSKNISPSMIFRCLHCASHQSSNVRNRLFNSQGIVSHIEAKHTIKGPKIGTDWVQGV